MKTRKLYYAIAAVVLLGTAFWFWHQRAVG